MLSASQSKSIERVLHLPFSNIYDMFLFTRYLLLGICSHDTLFPSELPVLSTCLHQMYVFARLNTNLSISIFNSLTSQYFQQLMTCIHEVHFLLYPRACPAGVWLSGPAATLSTRLDGRVRADSHNWRIHGDAHEHNGSVLGSETLVHSGHVAVAEVQLDELPATQQRDVEGPCKCDVSLSYT